MQISPFNNLIKGFKRVWLGNFGHFLNSKFDFFNIYIKRMGRCIIAVRPLSFREPCSLSKVAGLD
jgi:hypothetical protein